MKNIDPLEILFSDSVQEEQRKIEAKRIISKKEKHYPIVGAHKQSIIYSAKYGSNGNMFNCGGYYE